MYCAVLSSIFSRKSCHWYDSACAGCVVYGSTADRLAAEKETRGMLGTELLPALYLVPICQSRAYRIETRYGKTCNIPAG